MTIPYRSYMTIPSSDLSTAVRWCYFCKQQLQNVNGYFHCTNHSVKLVYSILYGADGFDFTYAIFKIESIEYQVAWYLSNKIFRIVRGDGSNHTTTDTLGQVLFEQMTPENVKEELEKLLLLS